MSGPIEFHITRHANLPGVRLSLSGSFVNHPFPNDAAAEEAAREEADGRHFTIERKSYRALATYGEPHA